MFDLQLVLKQYAHIVLAQKGQLIIIDFLININLILVILNKLNKLCCIIAIKILKRFDKLLQLRVVHVHKLLKQVSYPDRYDNIASDERFQDHYEDELD